MDVNNGNELLPSSFKFYDFDIKVGEAKFACQTIRLPTSLYLWIGHVNDEKMLDLSYAFMSVYDSLPVATKLVGSTDDSSSSNIAKRLTKKCGMPVYVSFNVTADNFTSLGIEKSISEEFKRHPEILE
ncbi:GSCOCG00006011001-RA-CDS [Cotesia congregata]|nr:GSCOCG00006011001-RA-CDS [Cotesia congregata]